MNTSHLPALVQRFFTQRLLEQQGVSPHTVASYRDTFRLLLAFATKETGRTPAKLMLEDLDMLLIERFLRYLERERGNSIRTRNTRLAGVHAFFQFVAVQEPALGLQCQRILAIPAKRCEHGSVEFLTEEEASALIASPDTRTWIGNRDRTLLLVAIQTGLRSSELRALRRHDVVLGTGAHVRCFGKGRKMRCTPLRPDVVAILNDWLRRHSGQPDDPLFPSSRGSLMSADALQKLVSKHVATASIVCPTLKEKTVTPHTLRHAAAMNLLMHGVDLSVIALWLGHESTETTQIYLHADMGLKERALAHTNPSGAIPARYKPSDPLLTFLESL
ncbi:site-specific integrase [Alcaligenaceae bacterium CGII-47]|nr:site-specific integrase [Alcaligenaceae bacterium CGII-47]